MPPAVLILDAAQRSALAATRSLGRLGYRVITADAASQTLAGCSKFSSEHWVYPDPYQSPLDFLDWAEDAFSLQRVQLALPMTEVTTDLLVRFRHRWPGVALPYADIHIIDSLADKITLHRHAERLGIPIPATRYVDDPSALSLEPDSQSYPLVLKPHRSRIWLGDRWLNTSVVIAHSPDELRTALAQYAFTQHPFMIQQCIDGEGQGIFALYDRGQPIAFFAHRRLRERPPWGGVSVLSESTVPDTRLQALARHILDDAGWHGVAMVEFKVAADGTPYLMEINTRFWGSLQLAIDAGVDFPALLLDIAQDHPVSATALKPGLRLRWLLGDVDNLYLTWRSSRYPLTHKLRTTFRFLWPDFSGRTQHEVNRWTDMAPAWMELKRYFRKG